MDLRTKANIDVCEYPDSEKINILPTLDIFEEGSKVSYYTGEEGVRDKWPEELLKKDWIVNIGFKYYDDDDLEEIE